MTHYDSTARVPFAKGGSVKDKIKEGLKNSPLNIKGAIEGYRRLGKKAECIYICSKCGEGLAAS